MDSNEHQSTKTVIVNVAHVGLETCFTELNGFLPCLASTSNAF